MLQAYFQTLNGVKLHGPTRFCPVIHRSAQVAHCGNTQQNQNFFVLLIITDGVIEDMDQTINEIVRATNLPLAIVIVGVGRADFKNMETLDADDAPLRSNGATAMRDIVQVI